MTDTELRRKGIDAGRKKWRESGSRLDDALGAAVDAVLAALPTMEGLTQDEIETACKWLPLTGHGAYREGWYDGVAWASAELTKRRTSATSYTLEQVQAAFDYAVTHVLLNDPSKSRFWSEMSGKLCGPEPDARLRW